MIAQCPVPLPNENFVNSSKKVSKKQQLNFSCSVLFHMKTRVSFKYFVNDCWFYFWKYKKSFFFWENMTNIRVRKFHFLKYKELFSGWIFLFFELGHKSDPGSCILYYFKLSRNRFSLAGIDYSRESTLLPAKGSLHWQEYMKNKRKWLPITVIRV